jgi:beta-glucosidase
MPADVDLMAGFGTQTYRFSVAWPRIYPQGGGRLNPKGFDFYQRLVDRLHEKNILPLATLYHWDLPQALQDAGGWQNRDTASRFGDYAATVFDRLTGIDRWVTINEAKVIVQSGHQRGTMAPGIKSDTAAGRVIHHLALGHGRAVQAFRAAGSPGQIGPCVALTPCYPSDDTAAAAAQTQAADAWQNTVYLDPILRGRYPDLVTKFKPGVREGLRSVQRDGDLTISTQPVDFIGINYYSPTVVDRSGKHLVYWPQSVSGQQIYPDGLYDIATRVHRDYQLPLIVTETGMPDARGGSPLNDQYRIDFLYGHLAAVQRAITEGVPVHGFHTWSLMDNWEWARGFTQRWGLVHMDYETQRRTPKQSAAWYADLIKSRQLVQ